MVAYSVAFHLVIPLTFSDRFDVTLIRDPTCRCFAPNTLKDQMARIRVVLYLSFTFSSLSRTYGFTDRYSTKQQHYPMSYRVTTVVMSDAVIYMNIALIHVPK